MVDCAAERLRQYKDIIGMQV